MGWRIKAICIAVVCLAAEVAFGQGTSFPVFNRQGWTMAGAVVATCNGPADPGTGTLYCVSPVTTYTDWTLTTPCTQVTSWPNPPGPPLGPTHGTGCTNPGQTDSHGNATIFAANGFYWAIISGYQVVPQTFPFSIGGGSGGITNFSSGNLPPAFTTSVSNPTTTPALSFTWDNWLADGFLLNATGSPAAPTIQTVPACANDGHHALVYVSHTLTCETVASGSAAISCENWFPVWYCNANFPATTTDITPAPWPQGVSSQFMGPRPGIANGPFIYQSRICTGNSSTATCQFLNPSKASHAICGVAAFTGTSGSMTDTELNTYTALWGPGVTPLVACAQNIAGSTSTNLLNTLSASLTSSGVWGMTIFEVGNVPASAIETYAHQIGGTCSGLTGHLATVTTTATDLIVSLNFSAGSTNGGVYFTAISPYFIEQQQTIQETGFFPWWPLLLQDALQSAGTITPTVTISDCTNDPFESETIAFKNGATGEANFPTFRFPYIWDWVQQGIVPDPSAVTIGDTLAWTGNANHPFSWAPSTGTGTVTSFSSGNLSPLFTTSVANPTTTPALTYTLSNFSADRIFGNFTGGSAPPSTQQIPSCANDGAHALTYPSHTLTCAAVAGGIGGVNTQTSNYTLQASDGGKLVVMNCSGSCTVTMYGTPSSTFNSCIQSEGSTTATVSLNALNYNGSSSVPVLIKYVPMCFYSDGSNYFGDSPPVAGSDITLTAASNGVTIAAAGGTVTTTGSPASGNLTKFSGSASITNGDLSGDITTSGTLAATVVKINGGNSQAAVNYSLAGKAIVTTFANLTASTALYSPSAYSGTIPANFSGTTAGTSTVKCKTNPSGTITFTLKDETAAATLGTVAVNSSCAATLATTGGTTQSLTAGNLLSMTPSGTDGSAIGIGITLYFTVTGP